MKFEVDHLANRWIIDNHQMSCKVVDEYKNHTCPCCGTVILAVSIINGIDEYQLFPELKSEITTTYTGGDRALNLGLSTEDEKHWQAHFNEGRCPNCDQRYISLEVDFSQEEHTWFTTRVFADDVVTSIFEDMILYELSIDNRIVGYGLFNSDAKFGDIRGLYTKVWLDPYVNHIDYRRALELIAKIYINSQSNILSILEKSC